MYVGEVIKIRAILVKVVFHIFFITIFDLPTFETLVVFMDNEVGVSPDKKVMVWMVWEANQLIRLRIQQSRRVHAEHADDDTFMLGSCSLWCLYWGSELWRHV